MRLLRSLIGLTCAALALLAGCAAPDAPPRDGAEVITGLAEPARPAAPVPAADLPGPVDGPLWTTTLGSPQAAGEMVVGLVPPSPQEPRLSVVGVDPAGITRWAVRTNPACASFGITRDGDRYLAIVLHSDAQTDQGKLATRTTASAYDVRTGRQVWGPVEVPGALRGPGLTFEPPVPGTGAAVMLAADDGRVLARGAEALYEHWGTAVIGRADGFDVVDNAAKLWTSADVSGPAGTVPRRSGESSASDEDVLALDWVGPDGQVAARSLHDLRTGRKVADVSGQHEISTVAGEQLVVVNNAETGQASVFDRGSAAAVGELRGASISAVANGVAYGSDETGAVAFDLRGGSPPVRGSWSAPEAITPGGLLLAPGPTAADGSQQYLAFRQRVPAG